MKCPNINSEEYKSLSSIVGGELAHMAWSNNGGYPMDLNADGVESKLYKSLVEQFGERDATRMKVWMLSKEFSNKHGAIFVEGHESVMRDNMVNGVHLAVSKQYDARTKLVAKRQADVEMQRKVDILLSNIEHSFPGMKIHRETRESMVAKGQKKNMEGFCDSDGAHINMDRIDYRAPIHELSHVIFAIFKETRPEIYAAMVDKAEAFLESRPDIRQSFKDKHPKFNHEDTINETLAIAAGCVSEKQVTSFLADMQIAPTPADVRGVLGTLKSITDAIWEAVRDFLHLRYHSTIFEQDIRNMSLRELFEGLTKDILEGKEILAFNSREREAVRAFHDGKQYNFTDEEIGVTRMANVSDLPNILINNPDRNAVKSDADNLSSKPNDFAQMLYRRAYTMNGGYTYNIEWLGKRFTYSGKLGEAGIKSKIIEDILPFHKQSSEFFSANMRTVMDSIRNGIPVEEAIKKAFTHSENGEENNRSYISVNQITRLVEFMGGNDQIKDVLPLSLLVEKHPQLRDMMDNSLIGFNPIVVIHSISDKGVALSISDVSAGDLGRSNTRTGEAHKLSGRFKQDYQSSSKIIWSNDKKDARAAALTLTLAGMNHLAKKNGLSLKIHRAGVYGMRGGLTGNVVSRNIYNLKEAFTMVRELMQYPEMAALNDNKLLQEVVADERAWDDKGMGVSHLYELQSYYNSEQLPDDISENFRLKLMGRDLSRTQHIKVLRQRQEKLQSKMDRNVLLNDPEYIAISKAILFYNRGWNVNNMCIDDISKATRNIINVHNVGNSIVQYASLEFEKAKSVVVNYANDFGIEIGKLIRASKESHGTFSTDSEKLFGHLFPKTTVIADKNYDSKHIKQGDKVTITLYNQIYCSSHPDTAKLLREKVLTKEDVALADFIVASVRKKYVEQLLHTHRYDDKYTQEKAEKDFAEKYQEGTIPVVPATQEQNWSAGRYKEFGRKLINKISNADIQWGDFMDSEFATIHSRFYSQMSFAEQLRNMGLEQRGGEYQVFDLNATQDTSNNLEYTIKMFMMDMERTRVYDEKVLPVYNDCIAITNYVERNMGSSQKNARDFIEEYFNLISEHKRRDQTEADKLTHKAAPVVRSVMALNSFVSLAYRPVIWLKSAYFNEQSSYISAFSNVIANMGVKNGNRLDMPTSRAVTEAHALIFADYHKVWALAQKMQLINGSQRDVLENVFQNVADKHLFKQQIAHIGNWYTDAAARAMSMVSYMLMDGSYAAHTYDEKTGELGYDVKKDRRFYAKEGDSKMMEGWDKVHEAIMDKQGDQGLLKDGKQIIGYDFGEINKRMKWYSDKYIIGSMDEYQRTMLGNYFAGAALGQFRGFSFDKIWNAVSMAKISGEYGGHMIPIQDENGEWITVEQQMNCEGTLRSFVSALQDMRKAEFWSRDTWQNMDPIRRKNIASMIPKLTIFLLIAAAIKALDLGDRDKRKISWMFSEIFIFNTLQNIYDNPVPVIASLKDIGSMVFGNKRWEKMYRFVGPVNDAIWIYELASDNDEVVKYAPTEKAKEKAKLTRERNELQERIREAEEAGYGDYQPTEEEQELL